MIYNLQKIIVIEVKQPPMSFVCHISWPTMLNLCRAV